MSKYLQFFKHLPVDSNVCEVEYMHDMILGVVRRTNRYIKINSNVEPLGLGERCEVGG